jgi:Glycosyltransferase
MKINKKYQSALKSNITIVIPLHLPIKYPCDYIDQTAKVLSKKYQVIFYDYYNPISWKNFFKKTQLKKFFLNLKKLKKNQKNDFILMNWPAFLPLARFSQITEINKKVSFFFLLFFLFLLRKEILIWEFYPLITKKNFFTKFLIYDCVDHLDKKIHQKEIIKKENKLFKNCDFIAFNSKALYEKKINDHSFIKNKSIYTVCGCNFNLFNIKRKKISKEKKIKIIFYGVLNYRINISLLQYIISNNNNYQFVIIGPIEKDIPSNFFSILKESNVFYIKKIPKNKLVDYLKVSSLGIIPYDTSYDFVKYSNPMKLYEYLAAGIPVVSTKILALENYPKDIVYTTNDKKEFSLAIKKLIFNWNEEKIKIAKKIAQKNRWENKVNSILKFIFKNEEKN